MKETQITTLSVEVEERELFFRERCFDFTFRRLQALSLTFIKNGLYAVYFDPRPLPELRKLILRFFYSEVFGANCDKVGVIQACSGVESLELDY